MEQDGNQDAANLVQINFALQIGKGVLNATAEVPAAPLALTRFVPAVHELSSNIVAATVSKVQEEGYQISCRAGCGACCRQPVPLSLFEADYLAAWIRSLPPEQQAILEMRFKAALDKLKEAGVLERLDFYKMPAKGGAEDWTLIRDYMKADVPCPFLQDESCSIHPIRPLICREYLVTSDPEFCVYPTKETVHPVPMPVRLSRAMISLGENVSAEKLSWVPLVFLFGWIKSGATVGRAYEMPGPELLRLVVEQLVTQDSEIASQN